ncbi:aminotransferase class V-fold PLP-dependent enzyme [Candidatus Woesearchaeota archaeon]|nr:aminotransferase class V-fold PLP-dependent enzyme [Candidatus Woesearchaeota archaeon]
MDLKKTREDFPILKKGIIYFDNACNSLKPLQVINKISEYYQDYPACAGRSIHQLSKRTTEEISNSRRKIRKFFNASKDEEIIFTKNTTEAINLLSNTLNLKKDNIILTTDKEHNSNLLPWQKFKVQPINTTPEFDLKDFSEKINTASLVAIQHTSNLDGTSTPLKEIIKIAHEHNVRVLVDGAQSAPHKEINLKKLDADFFVCSGHKMLGPSATGILYGKLHLLDEIPPFLLGGETVEDSTYENFKLAEVPHKFEAGLQNYAGIIGLGSAIDYLDKLGMKNISEHELKLNKFLTESLAPEITTKNIQLLGPHNSELRSGIFSFNIKNMDSHSVAIMLDQTDNICIRSGAHCVHSWFNKHNLKGSARASLYFYNTQEECERFIISLRKIIELNS